MGTLRYCLTPEMWGPGLCRARVSAPPTGALHATVGGSRVERCCPWTRTMQGFASRAGRPDCGRWCLGEEGSGSGRHCVGQRSPLAERRWLGLVRKEVSCYR